MKPNQARKQYRLYSSEEKEWIGKEHPMTEREAILRNNAMPQWSAMRWKEVEGDA